MCHHAIKIECNIVQLFLGDRKKVTIIILITSPKKEALRLVRRYLYNKNNFDIVGDVIDHTKTTPDQRFNQMIKEKK